MAKLQVLIGGNSVQVLEGQNAIFNHKLLTSELQHLTGGESAYFVV